MACSRLMVDPNDLAIVVIDVQPYFLDGWMAGESESLLARLEFLFALAAVYDVPFLATFEQPIETKGWLPERLEPFFPAHGQRHTKQTFNCCGEHSILEAIGGLGRSQIALAGGETDVCVLQSVLGLIERDNRSSSWKMRSSAPNRTLARPSGAWRAPEPSRRQ